MGGDLPLKQCYTLISYTVGLSKLWDIIVISYTTSEFQAGSVHSSMSTHPLYALHVSYPALQAQVYDPTLLMQWALGPQ